MIKCDVCGQFINLKDLESKKAVRRMTTPDSHFSTEDYETLCPRHYRPQPKQEETK